MPDGSEIVSTNQRDAIFTFAFETMADAEYRGMFRGGDRLISSLRAHPQIGSLLVANAFRSRGREYAKRVLRTDGRLIQGSGGADVVQPVRLRLQEPLNLTRLEKSYHRYAMQIRSAAGRMSLDRPAVVTCNPLVAAFGSFGWAHSLTYYARDDWAAHPNYRRNWPLFEAAYERLAHDGVSVCAVSAPIADRIATTGRSEVVPNGIDEREWLEPAESPPSWFDSLPCPRILYVGSLDNRLDLDAIEATSRAFPSATLLFVGPTCDAEPVERIQRLPNVRVVPHSERATVASVVSRADCCIIPHVRTPLTEAMSPLKLYEYLAGGAPTVVTALQPMAGIHPSVHLVESPSDFPDQVRIALERGRMPEDERLRFVRENSWTARHDRIVKVMLD